MDILKIGTLDMSKYVERKGLAWQRNDIDSTKTTRTKDGKLRRDKITDKRTIGYTLANVPEDKLAALDTALSASTFSATYQDLHGVQTRTFYCSSFKATLAAAYDSGSVWEGAEFTMIEV